MIPVQVSFWYEIEFCTAFPWESFYQNDTKFHVSLHSDKECWLLTGIRYPSQSTRPLISYRNESLYLLYMIPVQNVVRFHTGKNVSYRYENWRELVLVWLVPVWHFVLVSCKGIQRYKWAPGWTHTRMKLVPVSRKHPLRLIIIIIIIIMPLLWFTDEKHVTMTEPKPEAY